MFELLKKVLLVFVILEIICFILVSKWLGFGMALLLLLASSILGASLIRKGTDSAILLTQQVQSSAWLEIANARYVFAGLLLLIPGFITDVMGLLCLAPIVHRQLLGFFQNKKYSSANDHDYSTSSSHQSSRIIEGEFWKEDDKNNKR